MDCRARPWILCLARSMSRSRSVPTGFAVFGYAHVPWMKARQQLIDVSTLPGLPERAAMADLVAERLVAAGTTGSASIISPCRRIRWRRRRARGRLRRSFQGYVAEELPSVIGSRRLGDLEPAAGIRPERVRHQTLPVRHSGRHSGDERGVATHAADRLRAEVIDRLMCNFTADLDEICRRHGIASGSFSRHRGPAGADRRRPGAPRRRAAACHR